MRIRDRHITARTTAASMLIADGTIVLFPPGRAYGGRPKRDERSAVIEQRPAERQVACIGQVDRPAITATATIRVVVFIVAVAVSAQRLGIQDVLVKISPVAVAHETHGPIVGGGQVASTTAIMVIHPLATHRCEKVNAVRIRSRRGRMDLVVVCNGQVKRFARFPVLVIFVTTIAI